MVLYRNFTSFLLNLFDKTDELLYVRKDLAHMIYKIFFDNYNLILMVINYGVHTRLLFQTAIGKLFSMTYIDGGMEENIGSIGCLKNVHWKTTILSKI